MRKRPAEWDTNLRELRQTGTMHLVRTPIVLAPRERPSSLEPPQRVPEFDPDKEPDANTECTSFGFRPSDAVRLSNNDLTATLTGANSQFVLSKDWISAGHLHKKKSWEVMWGHDKSAQKTKYTENLEMAPWVGITTARYFDEPEDSFTAVFDILGTRRWDRILNRLPSSLPEEWHELKTSGEVVAHAEQNKKEDHICPGYAKVTFDIETHVMNIQFGRTKSDKSAKTWTLTANFDKTVPDMDWTQVRLVVWLRDSNYDYQRSVTLVKPSSQVRAA